MIIQTGLDLAKIGKELAEDIKSSETARQTYIDRVDRYWQYYNGVQIPLNTPWQNASNLFIPMIRTNTDALHSRMMSANFGVLPYIIVNGREESDMDKATGVEAYLDYLYTVPINLWSIGDMWILNGLVEGTGVIKQTYINNKKTRKQWVNNHANNTSKSASAIDKVEGAVKTFVSKVVQPKFSIKDKEEVESRPNIDVLQLKDYLVPKDSVPGRKPRWQTHIFSKYYHEMLLDAEGTEPMYDKTALEEVKKNRLALQKESESKVETTAVDQGTGKTDPENFDKSPLRWYEVWGIQKIDDKMIEVVITIDPESAKIIRLEYNDYFHGDRPFTEWRPFPLPNQYYGMSYVEIQGALQDEINKFHNGRANNLDLVINRIFKARSGSRLDVTKQKIYPGAIMFLNNPDDLQVFDLGQANMQTVNEEMMTRDYLEKVSGISDYNLGRQGGTGKGKTATGTLAVIQEGNLKFEVIIKRYQQAMAHMSGQTISNCQQYLPEQIGYVRRVLGKNVRSTAFPKMTRDQISGKYDMIPQGNSSSVNKVVKAQKAMEIFDMMKEDKFVVMNPTREYALRRDTLTSLDILNYEDYIGNQKDIEMLDKAGVDLNGEKGGQPQLPIGGMPVDASPQSALPQMSAQPPMAGSGIEPPPPMGAEGMTQ